MEIKPINNWHDYEQVKMYYNHTIQNPKITKEEKNKIEIFKVLIEQFERKGKVNLDDVVLEPIIDNIWDSVLNVSKYEQKGLIERGLKLGEEYGELSAEILKFVGYKRTSESEDEIRKKILLESSDCLIMVLDIMTQMNFTKEEVCEMTDKQINKWLNNLNK